MNSCGSLRHISLPRLLLVKRSHGSRPQLNCCGEDQAIWEGVRYNCIDKYCRCFWCHRNRCAAVRHDAAPCGPCFLFLQKTQPFSSSQSVSSHVSLCISACSILRCVVRMHPDIRTPTKGAKRSCRVWQAHGFATCLSILPDVEIRRRISTLHPWIQR